MTAAKLIKALTLSGASVFSYYSYLDALRWVACRVLGACAGCCSKAVKLRGGWGGRATKGGNGAWVLTGQGPSRSLFVSTSHRARTAAVGPAARATIQKPPSSDKRAKSHACTP